MSKVIPLSVADGVAAVAYVSSTRPSSGCRPIASASSDFPQAEWWQREPLCIPRRGHTRFSALIYGSASIFKDTARAR